MGEDLEWEMAGFCPPGKDPGFGEFRGKVSKVLQNGCAFIECREIKELYDQDAYVHSSVMHQCHLQLDDEICFNVHVNATGRPQVSAPCWKRKQRGWKRSWAETQEASSGGSSSFGRGKGVAKGNNGFWQRPADEVPKAIRTQLPAGFGAAGKGKGFGQPARAEMPEMHTASTASANAGDFLVGRIKLADPARGFSMIACPVSGFEADTYVHHVTASPEVFAVGDVVAFTFHVNEKGQPRADTIFKLAGFMPAGKTPSFPENVGSLSRVLVNGSGFIDCPELNSAYGKDVFVHGSVVEQCGLRSGDVLAFDIHISKDGNPQVSAPCWIRVSSESHQEPQRTAPAKGLPETWGGHRKGQSLGPPVTLAPSKGKAKGFGCSANGTKVTLSKGGTMRAEGPTSGAPGASPGHPSTGSKARLKGTPALANLPMGKASPGPAAQWLTPGRQSAGWQAAKGHQAPRKGTGGPGGPGRDTWSMKAAANHVEGIDIDWMPNGFQAGRVSLVDLEKNVSLVRCPTSGLSRDVYVHQSVAEPSALALNDVVCFKVHLNSKGLPQASAPFWKRVGIESTESFARFGEFQGLVVRSSEGGPFTIDCPEVTQLHGREAVMQEESADICQLLEGNLICFDVSVNEGGDPEAVPPCWICCSSEKWVKDIVATKQEDEAQDVDALMN